MFAIVRTWPLVEESSPFYEDVRGRMGSDLQYCHIRALAIMIRLYGEEVADRGRGWPLSCDHTGLSGIVALDASTVSRRFDAAKQNLEIDSKLAFAKSLVEEKYRARLTD